MQGAPGFRSSVAVLFLAAALTSRVAAASQSYPHQIATTLGLAKDPPCTICHRDLNGGLNTVTKPFGQAMQGFGLRSGDPASLAAAIQKSEQAKADSDGDGVPDVEELEQGKDPNDPSDEPMAASDAGADASSVTITMLVIPEPEHGCSIASHRRRRFGEVACGGLLLLVASAFGRRRRRASHPRTLARR
jgi:hypothetical protein